MTTSRMLHRSKVHVLVSSPFWDRPRRIVVPDSGTYGDIFRVLGLPLEEYTLYFKGVAMEHTASIPPMEARKPHPMELRGISGARLRVDPLISPEEAELVSWFRRLIRRLPLQLLVRLVRLVSRTN